ncbi:MAG: glycosyltransferase family 4 protein [Anaerolineae bacterium]|nr:glycosyltransferase family 4 protein [Anaerolineae bacterium]
MVTLNAALLGGLETYTRDVAFALQRLGHEITVISVHECPQVFAGWGDIPIVTLAPSNPLLFRLYFRLRYLVLARYLRRQPSDLVLVMHPYAAQAARRAGVRYWVWTYGLEIWGEWSPEVRAGLAGAERVGTISRFTADSIRSRLPDAPLSIVHPAVDSARFKPLAETKPPEPPFHLLSVGRLAAEARHKQFHVVIRNLVAIRERLGQELVYWIAGDGNDRPWLKALARECGVEQMVHFWGRVSDPDLLSLYQQCDLFVMPSRVEQQPDGAWRGEGFGIVYLEANACGKPVIGGNAGGATDAIEDGVTGLTIDPQSDQALVDAICAILSDPERAYAMGQAGRARVERDFSHAALEMRLKELIGE